MTCVAFARDRRQLEHLHVTVISFECSTASLQTGLQGTLRHHLTSQKKHLLCKLNKWSRQSTCLGFTVVRLEKALLFEINKN